VGVSHGLAMVRSLARFLFKLARPRERPLGAFSSVAKLVG